MSGNKDLNKKLNELISSLQDQAILDDYFDELKGLQDEQSPHFVTNTITTYLGGAAATKAELGQNLGEPGVEYPRVTYLADKLKGSSLRVDIAVSVALGWQMLALSSVRQTKEKRKKRLPTPSPINFPCLALFEGVRRQYSSCKGV